MDLSDSAVAFLDALVATVGFSIVVTSGTRSYEEQAAAMAEDVAAGKDLYKVYTNKSQKKLLDELMAAYEDDWPAIIERYTLAGVVLSWHLSGRAVDIRTRDLTKEQVQALIDAARDLGADPLDEGDHLHVEEF